MEGSISGLLIRRFNPINHAQFVDEIILLGSASVIFAKRFKCNLDHFLSVTEGKANSGKSCVYGWNYSPKVLREISMNLNYKVEMEWNSFIYLGIPIIKKGKL